MHQTNGQPRVRFGVFEFDRHTGELRRHGVRLRVCHQASRLLAFLLKRPGKIRTREELRHQLWPDTTFVNFDQSINKAVHELRGVLGDGATSPRFIETVVGQGYRFISPVQGADAARGHPEPRTKSIAVLPFVADPSEAGAGFVSSQIAAHLIDALSKIPAVRVLAYSMVRNLKLLNVTPQQIGKQLGVRHVVLGELVWQGDDLLLHAELIDVTDGAQIWGTQLQRHCSSLIECAAELAQEVLQQLQSALERRANSRITPRAARRARSFQ